MNEFGELAELELPACPVGLLFELAVVDEELAGVAPAAADPAAVEPWAPVCCWLDEELADEDDVLDDDATFAIIFEKEVFNVV